MMSEKVEWQKPTEEQWLLIVHLIISKLKSILFKNLHYLALSQYPISVDFLDYQREQVLEMQSSPREV